MTYHAVGFSDCSSCTTPPESCELSTGEGGHHFEEKELCSLTKGTTFCDEIFTIPMLQETKESGFIYSAPHVNGTNYSLVRGLHYEF